MILLYELLQQASEIVHRKDDDIDSCMKLLKQIKTIHPYEYDMISQSFDDFQVGLNFGINYLYDYYKSNPYEKMTLGFISERYERMEIIGAGSYGVVYKIFDHIDKVCKVEKFVYQDIDYNEIDILCRLEHPNILHADDFIFGKFHHVHIIMPYLSNDSIIFNASRFDIQTIKVLIKQLCMAIAFLHEEQVCHGDIKPSNILLDEKSNIKVCDFGASYLIDQKTTEWSGTPCLTSPQGLEQKYKQIKYREYCEKENRIQTDIFCIGTTISFMLGQLLIPWEMDNVVNNYNDFISNYESKMISFFELPFFKNDIWFKDFMYRLCHPSQIIRFQNMKQVLKHRWMDETYIPVQQSWRNGESLIKNETIQYLIDKDKLMKYLQKFVLPIKFKFMVISLFARYYNFYNEMNDSELPYEAELVAGACIEIIHSLWKASNKIKKSTKDKHLQIKDDIIEKCQGKININYVFESTTSFEEQEWLLDIHFEFYSVDMLKAGWNCIKNNLPSPVHFQQHNQNAIHV